MQITKHASDGFAAFRIMRTWHSQENLLTCGAMLAEVFLQYYCKSGTKAILFGSGKECGSRNRS